jgi:hypothetical protein
MVHLLARTDPNIEYVHKRQFLSSRRLLRIFTVRFVDSNHRWHETFECLDTFVDSQSCKIHIS